MHCQCGYLDMQETYVHDRHTVRLAGWVCVRECFRAKQQIAIQMSVSVCMEGAVPFEWHSDKTNEEEVMKGK